MSWKQTAKIASLASLLALIGLPAVVWASQSHSNDYQVNEVFFGAGGALNDCSTGSTGYCAKESIGETTVGNTKGNNYQAQGGFNTDRYPYLQFIVNGVTSVNGSATSVGNVGVLSTGSTSTATATFSVKAYLSSGYSVVTASPPPQNNAYTMHTLGSPTGSPPQASSAGTEQFGMNLVANPSSNPTCTGIVGLSGTLGAEAVQVPSSAFSSGAAASGYNTACKFEYNNGDIIASSTKSSGETDYTISYIYNISNSTPGGTFTFNDILVATATF